jgi:hypothetical protein
MICLEGYPKSEERSGVIAYTSEGLFYADDPSKTHVPFRVGNDIMNNNLRITSQQMEKHFLIPSLYQDFINGRPLQLPESVKDGVGPPPELCLWKVFKKKNRQKTMEVHVLAKDTGGGISAIRLFKDGVPMDENIPMTLLSTSEPSTIELVTEISTPSVDQKIEAVAYSVHGELASKRVALAPRNSGQAACR